MPVKSQQGIELNSDIQRTHPMSTGLTKTPHPISKRLTGHLRMTSGATKLSNDLAMVINANAPTGHDGKPLKMITEVDESNIEEVLSLSDLSRVPKTFLTEIQQDQAYSTIYSELQKKIPHRKPSNSPPPVVIHPVEEEEEEEEKAIQVTSPRVVVVAAEQHNKIVDDDDDEEDEISLIDDKSSTISSSVNVHPTTDGYDTDIESEALASEDHDVSGKNQYRDFCQQSNVIPCTYFMAHIQDKELVLRYHQFSNEDVRVISRTLSSNLFVEKLLLDGNFLQQQAAKYIAQMIVTNDFITELSLADNRLGGGEGTKDLCKMLTLNRNLKKINLSGNKFNEVDVVQLIEAFDQNKTLKELDLSYNCFGEKCGKALGAFIGGNESLESLDLSWNNIRGRSAIDIAHGLKENIRLKRCNLEMNGFGPEGGQVLAECIRQNRALEEFNISRNRLNTQNALAIAQGLLQNDSLQILKIANNQINCDGVLAIFLAIKGHEANALREVDFSHTVVTKETVHVCEDIVRLKNGDFRYSIGKVTKEGLQPNSESECYTRTDEAVMKFLQNTAAHVKV